MATPPSPRGLAVFSLSPPLVPEEDGREVHELARRLSEMDIQLEGDPRANARPGSKGVGSELATEFAVHGLPVAAVVHAVAYVIRDWIRTSRFKTIEIRDGDRSVSITGATTDKELDHIQDLLKSMRDIDAP